MKYKRLFQPPPKSFFLFGPRGTGKSTWLRTHYPDAPKIDLLKPDTYQQFHSSPERLEEFVNAHPKESLFIIDEVQKVPELLSMVHWLLENKPHLMFILTGSSSRKLKRSGVDLLAGRAQLKKIHPFMAIELGDHFSLQQAMTLGMVPLVVSSPDPLEDLKTYLSLYMKEEVQMEGLVRKVSEFHKFLEVISFSQASVLNYSNIARECHVSSATVENHVSILEDLLLGFRLPVFQKRAKRNLSTRPKFYFFDAGVYQTLRPQGPLDTSEEIGGHALETLIAQHLRAWLDYSTDEGDLYFWRTKSDLEVDFVIYGRIGFYAIEVKHSKHIHTKDLRGLKEFKKDYPECQCMLLYLGQEPLQKGDILCMPAETFLRKLSPNQKLVFNTKDTSSN